ncbi:helix-turn-helix domain-containing protein [Sphingobium lignivorans]|uniref:AraC family transcriptional activator of pobA n=1 Tax=Sphingobium lignivorans TaxID=2735886 RepID=A0ABR6NEP2_9SPHN|nr:helix-turn-helix domain-containing protein [Sphingobium lignivorans]MBB5985752.1 AraC family transcriptional activator of pobA [Sphingobium lignivorans]
MSPVSSTNVVPAYSLYGEEQRGITEGFVHVETLDERSRPEEWTIKPHVHGHLDHAILIARGGGTIHAEGQCTDFEAPALLLIPAGVIHGFSWHRESSGWVLTTADSYLRQLLSRDPDIASLFREATAVPLDAGDGQAAEQWMIAIRRELDEAAKGFRVGVEASLLALLVLALRRSAVLPEPSAGQAYAADLMPRWRARIEQRFRLREPVSVHARALGVSETTLRRACLSVAGLSPAAMIDQRALLEARRLLFYSQLSVAEVAYAIGFEDPGYFSRFFSRHTGEAPSVYRARWEKGS